MIEEIRKLMDDYSRWMKDRTALREIDGWVEITTPYIDRHNDYLQIYAKKQNGGFLLSDDGYVVEDLINSGCKLESPKRKELLRMTVNGFGVQLDAGKILNVNATAENFPLRKHSLAQAMLAVNDLFYLSVPLVSSLFLEDVTSWFELNGIRAVANAKFTGKTGYDHLFNFVIPKSSVQPERMIKVINFPSKDNAESTIMSWLDTKDSRSPDSKAYAFLNDTEKTLPTDVVDALRSYEVKPIAWSERESIRQELAA